MNQGHGMLKALQMIGLAMILGVSVSACSESSWKEEVLLHDGSKIIVTRSQSRGGRGEIGQSPIKEQAVTFTLPGSNKTIVWKDEYSEDVGHSNFELLALHILDGTPYIVTSPYLSSAYKKWGSPNPPYVLFMHDGKAWKRIDLSEFPAEFKDINLVINTSAHEDKLVEETRKSGFVLAGSIRKLNSSLTQQELKTIVRKPLDVWKARTEHTGPKAPISIAPPNSDDKK
jgi:hypothetical protein